MDEKAVTIIIGRGRLRPDLPDLSTEDWGSFQGRIIEWLVCYGKFFRLIPGVGVSTTGKAEENATIFGAMLSHHLNALRTKLAELTELYEQGAILLFVGDFEAIQPRPMERG